MKNEIYIKISGLNLSRLIDKLVAKNVLANNLVIKGTTAKFSIDEKNLPLLDKVCKSEHKFYTIIYKNGYKQILSKIPFLFGSFFALILIYVYMFSFSIFVFEVDVSYSSSMPYDISKVETLLKDNGVCAGVLKSKVDAKKIENLLLLNIDNISGCTVKCSGGRLSVCVYPAVDKKEPITYDLVSKYDAVVTKIDSFVGSSSVKVGDIVKKGDVLIKNCDGAQGVVEGKVYFVSTIIYNENQQKLIKTGNIFKTKTFSLFNKKMEFKAKQCNFTTYLTENCSFYVCDNYFLPIICNETTYYETIMVSEVVPFEVVEGKITKQAYEKALDMLPDKSNVSNVSYSIVKDGAYTRVDCFVESEISLI